MITYSLCMFHFTACFLVNYMIGQYLMVLIGFWYNLARCADSINNTNKLRGNMWNKVLHILCGCGHLYSHIHFCIICWYHHHHHNQHHHHCHHHIIHYQKKVSIPQFSEYGVNLELPKTLKYSLFCDWKHHFQPLGRGSAVKTFSPTITWWMIVWIN